MGRFSIILTIAIILAALPLSPACAAQRAIEEWVAKHDAAVDDWGSISHITLDNSGNIYVLGQSHTGGTGYDYCTIKYTPGSNTPVWVARYNGPGNGDDMAFAIATDNSGNIYVTGDSYSGSTGIDYCTIKYSPDSNQPVWIARHSSSGNYDDYARAIAVDDSNNIYVTGRHYTIKYGPDSNVPVWVDIDTSFSASAIAIDNSGNICVTGTSSGDSTSIDYCTIKYAPDGNKLWVAQYNGPGNLWDSARAIAVDNSDNIYVTGRSDGGSTDYDYCTIKYNPDSNTPAWVARYNGPGNSGDRAEAIVVDDSNNVYVTGYSDSSSTGFDYCTIKYASDGNELWIARYGEFTDELAYDIAIDDSNNIYVTGIASRGFTGEPRGYYLTIKYGPDSNEPIWTAQYNGDHPPFGTISFNQSHITINDSGNIYVAALTQADSESSDLDYTTIKYKQCRQVGDVDCDDDVDFADFAWLGEYWLQTSCDNCGWADLDDDEDVDRNDLIDLANNWLKKWE